MADAALFELPLRVYYEDTDLGGVVYYANYLKFMERTRTEWLRSFGLENRSLLMESGLILVVTRCEIEYRRAARMDDLLTVTVQSAQARRVSAKLVQKIFRESELLVEATIEIACIEAATHRIKPLPELITHRINQGSLRDAATNQ